MSVPERPTRRRRKVCGLAKPLSSIRSSSSCLWGEATQLRRQQETTLYLPHSFATTATLQRTEGVGARTVTVEAS